MSPCDFCSKWQTHEDQPVVDAEVLGVALAEVEEAAVEGAVVEEEEEGRQKKKSGNQWQSWEDS